ncbi:MAG: pyridoxamine 5'-phosphate oxidase family protein [Anaerolineae bacterium]|nr:pyridoxamine 5'-phosphate oxidase family protein [Anaerolineae bacterium]
MATIPDTHKSLLDAPIVATLTTVSPDNAPENTIVWCSYDGTHVLVNTAAGRRKIRIFAIIRMLPYWY